MSEILINPTFSQAITLFEGIPGNMMKTIVDDFGNLYLWDGELYDHQEVMSMYRISQEQYATARRLYKDFCGMEAIADLLAEKTY